MPTAHAYAQTDHAARLEAAYRQHLAEHWDWGGVTHDEPGPLATRPAWAMLERRLGQHDQLLVMRLDVFATLRDTLQTLTALHARHVGVYVVDTGLHLNEQTPTGRNALALLDALGALPTTAHQPKAGRSPVKLFDRNPYIHYGYERLYSRSDKRWRTFADRAMREQMRLIAELRDDGKLSWQEIAKLLGQRKLTWRGRRWSRERVCAAYNKEMELRRHEAECSLPESVDRKAG